MGAPAFQYLERQHRGDERSFRESSPNLWCLSPRFCWTAIERIEQIQRRNSRFCGDTDRSLTLPDEAAVYRAIAAHEAELKNDSGGFSK